jgi:hypothetical protein
MHGMTAWIVICTDEISYGFDFESPCRAFGFGAKVAKYERALGGHNLYG